jgi:hypothetical protein
MITRNLRCLRRAVLILLLASGSAHAADLPVAVSTPTSGILATPDGNFSFGAQCTGSDCPAAQWHVSRNGTVLAGVSGICFRGINGADPYLMDGYGVWFQWSPSAGKFAAAATAPGPLCGTLPYTADGQSGTTVVSAAGTWSLGAACFGSFATLLNGSHVGSGCGNLYTVHHVGQVYIRDSANNWWQWNASTSAWNSLGTTTQP